MENFSFLEKFLIYLLLPNASSIGKFYRYRGYFILDYMYFMQVKNLLQISGHFIPQKFPNADRNKAAQIMLIEGDLIGISLKGGRSKDV